MNFRTLFFVMLYVNGLLAASLVKEWIQPPPLCAVVVDAAKQKPMVGESSTQRGG